MIAASLTAWVMVTVVVVISVVGLVVAVVMIEAVIGTFVKVLAMDMRAGVLISNVAVDLDALTDTIRGVPTNINVDVLIDENVNNMFTGVLTALEFDMLEEFRC